MITPSPITQCCRDLISWLQSDPDLQDLVHPDVFDAASQAERIAAAANVPGGLITVTPGNPYNAHPDNARAIRMTCPILVSILATRDAACPDDWDSQADWIDAVIAHIVRHIRQWQRPAARTPYDNICVDRVDSIAADKIEGLANITGKGILLSVSLNY